MDEKKSPPLKADFDSRLKRARGKNEGPKRSGKSDEPDEGLGLAFRVGTEVIAALVIGIAIGFGLDLWLGTKPWFFISFAVLGGAAGILNVFRLLGNYGYAAGYKLESKNEGGDMAESGKRDKREIDTQGH